MRARDELLHRPDDLVTNCLLCSFRRSSNSNVVHALEEERVADAGLGEDVAVKAPERVRTEAVREDAVPARGLVRKCEGTDERRRAGVGGVRTRKDKVWPAVVRVVVRAAPVGDAVADKRDRADLFWDPCVERADEVPAGRDGTNTSSFW